VPSVVCFPSVVRTHGPTLVLCALCSKPQEKELMVNLVMTFLK
jgi:hypothetical protein